MFSVSEIQVQKACYDTFLSRATSLGEEHGRNAASWYFDGNTSDETYRAVLRGIDDGDPMILDTFPSAPLSGEWADDPTPDSIVSECYGSDEWTHWDDLPLVDDILRAYEDGFYTASTDEIERVARYHVAPSESATALDLDRAYRAAGWGEGIAWRVDSLLAGSRVNAHMIGDDSNHVLDADDLTPIGEDDYCSECGQIGCKGDQV